MRARLSWADGLNAALGALKAGQLIGYPSDTVYALGCDPHCDGALAEVLARKNRPAGQGLILLASSIAQLDDFIDAAYIGAQYPQVLHIGTRATTWCVPPRAGIHPLLTGDFDTLAVRLSHHPVVSALCAALNSAIVSTSANWHHHPPAKNAQEFKQFFADIVCVEGSALGAPPSVIKDAKSGKVMRA